MGAASANSIRSRPFESAETVTCDRLGDITQRERFGQTRYIGRPSLISGPRRVLNA